MLMCLLKRVGKVWLVVFAAVVLLCGQRVQGQELQISAESAIVLAADSGSVLYEKDAHTQRPMASTTKIMTALLTLEAAERLGDPVVEITGEMVAVEGSSMGLQEGDCISLRNLAAGMLLASGNDAANAAAIYLAGSLEEFVDQMNQRAVEMGMENTHFVTPSGLDGETPDGKGHYSTAYDMALLAGEALENPVFLELCSSQRYTVCFADPVKQVAYTNHNKLLEQYDGCIGVKTGYTKQAGRCLVSAAERDGVRLISVTLNAPDDWQDHATLLDYGFSQVETVSLKGETISGKIPVVGAETPWATFLGTDGGAVALAKGEQKNITSQVFLPAFLYAPVQQGQQVGEMRWYLGEKELGSSPIIAGEEISIQSEDPGFWEKVFGKKKE